MRQLRKILTAPALAQHYENEIHPSNAIETDEQIFAKAKERIGTVFHPVGTCKMGSDAMAVVDNQLKVHGIDKLRVISPLPEEYQFYLLILAGIVLLVHLHEYFAMKAKVKTKSNADISFVQTMLWGLCHWLPLLNKSIEK